MEMQRTLDKLDTLDQGCQSLHPIQAAVVSYSGFESAGVFTILNIQNKRNVLKFNQGNGHII